MGAGHPPVAPVFPRSGRGSDAPSTCPTRVPVHGAARRELPWSGHSHRPGEPGPSLGGAVAARDQRADGGRGRWVRGGRGRAGLSPRAAPGGWGPTGPAQPPGGALLPGHGARGGGARRQLRGGPWPARSSRGAGEMGGCGAWESPGAGIGRRLHPPGRVLLSGLHARPAPRRAPGQGQAQGTAPAQSLPEGLCSPGGAECQCHNGAGTATPQDHPSLPSEGGTCSASVQGQAQALCHGLGLGTTVHAWLVLLPALGPPVPCWDNLQSNVREEAEPPCSW